jgi:predicted CopG family antitoxin
MIIDLAGNLSARANQFLGSMQRLGTGGSRSMQMLQRSVHAAGQGLDRLGNRYTALLTGAAGIGALKMVGDLSERLAYLANNASLPRQEIDKLYNSILDVAQAPDIRVDPSGILSGVETIVEKLGDLQLAKDNMRNIGLVMRATGADGKDAGDMIANFREKFNIKSPDEMLQALDIMVKQGKAGAFTLKDMVTQGNRVTAAYGSMGRSGLDAVREMGAVLQVFRKSSGNAEETSTAFKNFFGDLIQKRKELAKHGINIWDPAKLKEGKKEIRSAVDIIDDIMVKTKGDPEKAAEIFGMQSLDGMKSFIKAWNSGGKNAAKEYMAIQGDGKTLTEDAANIAREYNASIRNIYTSWQRFASSNLMKPVQKLADSLNSLESGTVERWLKVGTAIGVTVGALILAKKGIEMFRFGRDLVTGGKGKGSGLGGLAGGGPIPVYVVNNPASMLTGGNAGGNAASTGSKILKNTIGKIPSFLKAGTLARLAGMGRVGAALAGTVGTVGAGATAGAVLAAGSGGYMAGKGINSLIGWGMGKMSGGKYKGSGAIGEMLYDFLHKQPATPPKKQEVGGEIRIKIESDTPARVAGMKSKNSKVPLNVDSGLMYTGF